MVNRGEEKVRVHMNAVPRSTGNTNSGRELTLKYRFFFASCGSLFPFTRANAQWVIHGFNSTIIYTSELILCSTNFIKS